MPISSGANRWPKSYWTKPQPRLLTVAERVAKQQSVPQRHKPRSSFVNSPSKQDTGTQPEPCPLSNAEMERPAMRSPGVVVPLSTKEGLDHGGVLPQSLVLSTTVQETSSSTKRVVCPLKFTCFKRNVSRPTATFSVCYFRISVASRIFLTYSDICSFTGNQLRSTFLKISSLLTV